MDLLLINLETISEERFQEWQTEAYSFVAEEQEQFLDERWGGGGSAGGLFGGFFGVVFASGDAYHYKDQANSSFKATQDFQKGFAKSVHNLESADFRVTGNIKATGTSRIPTRVKVFFQLTTIVFSDNRKLTVVDTANPIAADVDSGDTRRVITEPGSKLKILPIDP